MARMEVTAAFMAVFVFPKKIMPMGFDAMIQQATASSMAPR